VSILLVIALVCLCSLAALAGVLLLLLKLGVIAHHYTRPEPRDESSGHTLEQIREAGIVAPTPEDTA
jgi:hypothetical protein